MATSGGLPWWKDSSEPGEDPAMDEPLRRAMDEDPRLASGAGPARADNVLDFIQMTGLTTGRLPQGAAPDLAADDPISFFEHGVRDVDDARDPAMTVEPELDLDAFHPGAALALAPSRSLDELKQIIAELAAESDPARATYARLKDPDPTPAPALALPMEAARFEESAPTMDLGVALAEPAPAAAMAAALAAPQGPAQGLAVARDLVRELAQANDDAAKRQRAVESHHFELKHPVTAAREGLLEPEADKEDFSSHSHLGLPRRRRRSILRRWLPGVAAALLLAAVAAGLYEGLKLGTRPPRAAFEAAKARLDAGEHRAASDAFLAFSKRHDGHPLASEALFMAGYALQLEPPTPAAQAKEAYSEAIGILERFREQYPNHAKIARAETLTGLLYFKTGRALEAISLLGDPERRVRDPDMYLLTLRTLARAYVEVGQIDNARSAFLRAASLENNIAPDQDYVELASLYQELGARSGDPAQRRKYFAQAIEQWDFAMQVPGLIRARKEDIKLLRDAAASKLNAVALPGSAITGTAAATAGETPGNAPNP